MLYNVLLTAVTWASLISAVIGVDPAAVYDGGFNEPDAPIKLRIGNGGAGQAGLVKALADAFINDQVGNNSSPFKVAWYQSDTTVTVNLLKAGTIDAGITYSQAAEELAIEAGIAIKPRYYAFRDHFLIAGPPSNPAKLNSTISVRTLFSLLFQAAEATKNTTSPARFLTRYDKSATNIKESTLWLAIGQVPWATAYSTWYHQYIDFPLQALTAAIKLGEYTLTDRGTFLSLPQNITSQTVVYKAASDEEDDPLLNPAHLIVGQGVENEETARGFAEWLVGRQGQDVIRGFEKNGEVLYSPAPEAGGDA